MGNVSVKKLWWLHPGWLFALIVGSTMALALSQTEQNYNLYNTPKYLHAYHGVLAAGAIAVFVLGCQLALLTGRVPTPLGKESIPLLTRTFHVLFGLTLFGYVVWLLVGIKNGFSIGMIRDVLFGDDAGEVYGIATDVFANVSGVTTCTQFAIAAIPIGVWLFSMGVRHIGLLVAIVLSIAFARAFMLSERLSLVELVVPASIVFVRQYVLSRKSLHRSVAWCLKGAPFLGVVCLLVFFGSAEYLRSWKLYQKDFDSVVGFTVWRISGYYTTSHNNGAMALETKKTFDLPYYTVQSLWAFPGVPRSPMGYKNLTGVDPEDQHLYMLERFGTEELNNFGGLFGPAMDYGILGFFVYWFGCGFVSGRLYRCYMVGSIAGITLYPLFFLSILEVPRLLYLPNQRVFPSLVAIAIMVWLVYRKNHSPTFSKSSPSSVIPSRVSVT